MSSKEQYKLAYRFIRSMVDGIIEGDDDATHWGYTSTVLALPNHIMGAAAKTWVMKHTRDEYLLPFHRRSIKVAQDNGKYVYINWRSQMRREA